MSVIYSLVCIFWAILGELHWMRRAFTLRFQWGLLGPQDGVPSGGMPRAPDMEDPLPTYSGSRKKGIWYGDVWVAEAADIVQESIHANSRLQRLRKWISYCVVALCVVLIICLSLLGLLGQLVAQERLPRPFGKLVGAAVLAVVTALSDAVFSQGVAGILTNFENHRVSSTFEHHLGVKQFSFFFVSTFSPLYFVAFGKKYLGVLLQMFPIAGGVGLLCASAPNCCLEGDCARELEMVFIQVFMTKNIVNFLVKDYLVPLVSSLFARKMLEKRHKNKNNKKKLQGWQLEATRPPFKGTLPMYQHLSAQFGFITLFAACNPLAPLLALIVNALWLRNQASALVNLFARPRYLESVRGPLMAIRRVTTALAIITNVGLVLHTFALIDHSDNAVLKLVAQNRFIVAVAIEHVILILWGAAALYIPEKPGTVSKRIGLALFQQEKTRVRAL